MIWTTRQRSDFGDLRAIGADPKPQLLLIHGVGLRAEAFNAQLASLATDLRVVAVDMPGHGESTPFVDTPTMADFADRIAAAIIAPTVVIGHSMGAVIALDIASRFPNKVLAVGALNGIFNRSEAATKAICARADALDPGKVNDPTATLQRWFKDLTCPEAVACKSWLTSVNPQSYKTAYSLFANQTGPKADDLKGISVPALFMTGGEEPNSTPQMSLEMADLVQNGRAVIVDGAAHMMPMTHPDVVGREIRKLTQGVWHD